MATMDLNAQLLREISAIISDKELTEKTLTFVRSLRRQHLRASLKGGEEKEMVSKEEMKEMMKEGLREVKLIKDRKLKGIPAEEIFK